MFWRTHSMTARAPPAAAASRDGGRMLRLQARPQSCRHPTKRQTNTARWIF